MLTIWGRTTSSNVQKVMWAVAELGIEFERIDVGGLFGGLDTPEFRAMNPNGLIPVIDDGGTVVWESHAIVRYLALRYGAGSLWPDDAGLRAHADQWMDWMHTTLQPGWSAVFWGLVRTPPARRDRKAIQDGVERLAAGYRILDAALEDRDYLVGDSLTAGDIPAGASLYRYFELDIKRPSLPNVEAWYERLKARGAYVHHVMVSFESLRVRE